MENKNLKIKKKYPKKYEMSMITTWIFFCVSSVGLLLSRGQDFFRPVGKYKQLYNDVIEFACG